MQIKIEGITYEIPDVVGSKWQQLYNDWVMQGKKLDLLTKQAQKVRRLQKEYYAKRDGLVLKASKFAESELDALLSGEKKQDMQGELFR